MRMNSKKQFSFILGHELIKDIIKTIFTDSNLMGGYTNLDLDTYNCVENIFMIFN